MADLLGVRYDSLAFRVVESEEEYRHMAAECRYEMRNLREYEKYGYPSGVCTTTIEYQRHAILIFSWQIDSYWMLNEVLLHEIAHVMTAEAKLLSAHGAVRRFVDERVIAPITRAVYYDPLLKLIQPRRVQAPSDDPMRLSVQMPGTPQRLA